VPLQLCVDFLTYRRGHKFSNIPFNIGGFVFDGPKLIVTLTSGTQGLRFSDYGIKIQLPGGAVKIRLKIGQFATPIGVKVSGVRGVGLASAVVNQPNTYSVHTFGPFTSPRRATAVTLGGGNNEGIIAQICAWV
jgi:hypothetical protein